MRTLLLLLLLPFMGLAQEETFRKVDMSEIEKIVTDSSSSFYLPNLMKRYYDKDTNLTVDDYFYMYYGYATKTEYSGYSTAKDAEKLKKILNQKDDLNERDLNRVISLCGKILEEVPFDIDNLAYMAYAYKLLGQMQNFEATVYQYRGVLEAINTTGDGKSEKTAFWVIRVDNEYTMLNWLDLEFGGQQSLSANMCDKLTVKKNKQKYKAVYFNVTIPFTKMGEMFKESNEEKK